MYSPIEIREIAKKLAAASSLGRTAQQPAIYGDVTAAVKQVFIAGLYVYITDNTVPPGFDKESMTSAFVAKGK